MFALLLKRLPMPTHAEVMARTLAERGVEYVFGLPGGEILAFIDACRRTGLIPARFR